MKKLLLSLLFSASLIPLSSYAACVSSVEDIERYYSGSLLMLPSCHFTDNDIVSSDPDHPFSKPLPAFLIKHPDVVQLYIPSSQIGPAGAKTLSKIPSLTALDISYNPIGNDGVKALVENGHLIRLSLVRTNLDYQAAQTLAQSKTIQILELKENFVGSEGIKALAGNTVLTYLGLESSPMSFDDQALQALADDASLKILDLSNNRLGNAGLQKLSSNIHLDTLIYQENGVAGADGVKALASMSNLTSLDLSGNPLGDEGLAEIAKNKYLTMLMVNSTAKVAENITGKGIAKIIFEQNGLRHLKWLEIAYNMIGDGDDKKMDGGGVAIASLPLDTLVIYNSNLHDATGMALVANPTLRVLDVSYNHLTMDSIGLLQEQLFDKKLLSLTDNDNDTANMHKKN